MHPQTLRKYERLGLVQPTRTIGSMRLYSRDELERLRLIKRLVDDGGINLAGVQRLLSIAEVVQRIRPLMRDERCRRATGAASLLDGDAMRARLARCSGLLTVTTWNSRTTTPRSASRRPPPRRRSSRRSGSWRASTIRTSIRATRPPRRGSRRSTRPTKCSAIPTKRKKYDELGANWRMYEQARRRSQAAASRILERRRRRGRRRRRRLSAR